MLHTMTAYLGNETDENDKLPDPDAVMQASGPLVLRFDYPLRRPAVFTFEQPAGPQPWTQRRFVAAVREGYGRIYAQEEAAVGNPGHAPGMLNRKVSDGPYGIWGHDLEDLVLEGAEQQPDGTWRLCVGS